MARNEQGRREAEENSGQNGGGQSEPQDGVIDGEVLKTRRIGRKERAQRGDAPKGEEQTASAARERKQEAFGEQLTNDSGARGTKRGANGEFAAARPRSRKE